MKKDETKSRDDFDNEDETVAVLLRVPKPLYAEYLKIVNKKALRRQRYSSDLFCESIKKVIEDNS